MMNPLHLCPCCAAHLRVPAELHVLRCNSCDADLVWLNQGGVRGLALVPPPVSAPPYSNPDQWARRANARPFDAQRFVTLRRTEALVALGRKRAMWAGLFWLCAIAFAVVAGCGMGGFAGVLQDRGGDTQGAVLAMLVAVMVLPLLSYVALYFQGRARLLAESMKRYEA